MSDQEELAALRRLAELESKAGGGLDFPGLQAGAARHRTAEAQTAADPITQGARAVADEGILPNWLAGSPGGTYPQRVAAAPMTRFAMGAGAPAVGAAQLGSNLMGSDYMNNQVSELESMKRAGGLQGTDWLDLAGQVMSPANIIGGKAAPAASSTIRRAMGGAAASTAGAMLTPVTDGDYWQQKGAGAGVSALAGAAGTPILGKLMDTLVPKVQAMVIRYSPTAQATAAAQASTDATIAINKALEEIGAKAGDISAAEMAQVRQQVVNALKAGKQTDPAAIMRHQDFNGLGMQGTTGQITRDPTQFAKERNLRGVAGLGEPLQIRFDEQNQKLQSLAAALKGTPSEPYQAGQQIIKSLSDFDAGTLKPPVDTAYAQARDHLGRAAPMNAQQFSQTANEALDSQMLGRFLPEEARGLLNDVSSGAIPFNVNTAVQMDSVLSAAQRKAGQGSPQSLAIGKVRDALNSAGIADNVGEEAKATFDKARGLAKGRFDVHRDVPALQAALNDEAPDRFVQKYVLGGNVDEVQRLASLLKQQSPEAFDQARSQIGDKIVRAAFGENTAGDKLATPERLARALREIGTDKLGAFYSPAEIEQFKRMSRVTAYINSTPSAAPVNTSNNIGAMTGMALKLPGVPASAQMAASLAKAIGSSVSNGAAVKTAMAGKVPMQAAQPGPEQAKMMARLLTAAGLTGGVGISGALAQ